MEITIKDYNDLLTAAAPEATVPEKQLDEQFLKLLTFIAGKTLNPDSFEHTYFKKALTFNFYFQDLAKDKNLRGITIPEKWVDSIEFTEEDDNIFCRICGYSTNLKKRYDHQNGKIKDEDEDGNEILRWELWNDVKENDDKETVCPICFKQGTFVDLEAKKI